MIASPSLCHLSTSEVKGGEKKTPTELSSRHRHKLQSSLSLSRNHFKKKQQLFRGSRVTSVHNQPVRSSYYLVANRCRQGDSGEGNNKKKEQYFIVAMQKYGRRRRVYLLKIST